MIPEKANGKKGGTSITSDEKEKIGNFPFFDPIHFIRRLIKKLVLVSIDGYFRIWYFLCV